MIEIHKAFIIWAVGAAVTAIFWVGCIIRDWYRGRDVKYEDLICMTILMPFSWLVVIVAAAISFLGWLSRICGKTAIRGRQIQPKTYMWQCNLCHSVFTQDSPDVEMHTCPQCRSIEIYRRRQHE